MLCLVSLARHLVDVVRVSDGLRNRESETKTLTNFPTPRIIAVRACVLSFRQRHFVKEGFVSLSHFWRLERRSFKKTAKATRDILIFFKVCACVVGEGGRGDVNGGKSVKRKSRSEL